jgi:hypothetical protein
MTAPWHEHTSVAGLGSVVVAAVVMLGPTPTGVALLLLPAVMLSGRRWPPQISPRARTPTTVGRYL